MGDPVNPFIALREDANVTRAGFEAADVTPASEIPTSGSASYEGYFGSVTSGADTSDIESLLDDPLALVGDMVVDVAFDAGTMTGEASNVVRGDGIALGGVLTFEGGNIDAQAGTFDGTLNGSLTFPASSDAYSYTNFELGGVIKGENAHYIGAVGEGDFEFSENESIPFDMGFIVEATE